MSLFSVKDRVAVVTGASSGIGQHLASTLVRQGARVVAVARRAERLEEWRDAQAEQGAIVSADLGSSGGLSDAISKIQAAFGDPDILISAAGLNLRQVADEVTEEGWEATFAINLTAPFKLAQAFVPAMKAKGWGRIINFGSLQSERAFPGGIAYGSAKGGVLQLTRAMAEAWSPHGITANAVGPGFFPTELTGPVFADPERSARNAAQTCIGRNGTMEDLEGPTLFLCSNASAYVTGQMLYVDGGFTAK